MNVYTKVFDDRSEYLIVMLDYSTYNEVKDGQQVDINLPLFGKVVGTLETQSAYLSGQSVFCNARINKKLDPDKFRGTISCDGEILLSNTSILKKIFSK
jgi:hypothetical protein